jgi:hypothetical protein
VGHRCGGRGKHGHHTREQLCPGLVRRGGKHV